MVVDESGLPPTMQPICCVFGLPHSGKKLLRRYLAKHFSVEVRPDWDSNRPVMHVDDSDGDAMALWDRSLASWPNEAVVLPEAENGRPVVCLICIRDPRTASPPVLPDDTAVTLQSKQGHTLLLVPID
jgi:hypothetical protein